MSFFLFPNISDDDDDDVDDERSPHSVTIKQLLSPTWSHNAPMAGRSRREGEGPAVWVVWARLMPSGGYLNKHRSMLTHLRAAYEHNTVSTPHAASATPGTQRQRSNGSLQSSGNMISTLCSKIKHVTTFLMISWCRTVRLQRFLAHLLPRV